MNPLPHNDEHMLDDALRDLPPRRAPASLEAKIMRELQRRHAMPWWRMGFQVWPLGARAAFCATCCGIVGFTVYSGPWVLAAALYQDFGTATLSRLQPAAAAVAAASELVAVLTRLIPLQWWYGALLIGGFLYAALFGLGAAAYRALYFRPSGG